MTNIFQKLSFVVTTTVLSLSVINANPINAASMTYDFEVNMSAGSLLGQTYSGSFEFDDSTLTEIGEESLSVSELSFNFLGVNYTEDSLSGTPQAIFDNGDFSGLDFAGFTVDGSFLRLKEGNFTFVNFVTSDFSPGDITYTSVPEPTAVFSLLALGAIGSIRILKKGR